MENNRECHHCDASHPELITAYFPFLRYSEEDVTPRMRPVFERYQAAAAHLDGVCAISGVPRETSPRARQPPDRLHDHAPSAGRRRGLLRSRRGAGVQEAHGRRHHAPVRRPVPAHAAQLLVPPPQRPRGRLPRPAARAGQVARAHHLAGPRRRRRRRGLRHRVADRGVAGHERPGPRAGREGPARRHRPELRARSLRPGRGRRRVVHQLVRPPAPRLPHAAPRARRAARPPPRRPRASSPSPITPE